MPQKEEQKKKYINKNLTVKYWLESAETTEEYSIHCRHTVLVPAFGYTKEINCKRKQYENLQSGACTSLSLLPRCTSSPFHFHQGSLPQKPHERGKKQATKLYQPLFCLHWSPHIRHSAAACGKK